MPDRHIRALREKLDRLLDTTRKLEGEIADALKKSASDASSDKPAKPVNRRVAKGPRRKRQKKVY
jgi:hypothetical protein